LRRLIRQLDLTSHSTDFTAKKLMSILNLDPIIQQLNSLNNEIQTKTKSSQTLAEEITKQEKILSSLTKSVTELITREKSISKEIEEREKNVLEREKLTKLSDEKANEIISKYKEEIILNIGGSLFYSTKTTLASQENLFYSLFSSGKFEPNSNGEYFFDRDPEYFLIILNYLRGYEIEWNLIKNESKFYLDLDFYQIFIHARDTFKLEQDSKNSKNQKLLIEKKEKEIYQLQKNKKMSFEEAKQQVFGGKVSKNQEELEFTYKSDFDENGIIYWLGTKEKTQTFQNPHDLGLTVGSESWSVQGKGHIAFGREIKSNYIPDANYPGWFQIEFKSYSIIPNYYTVRTDNNGNYAPRNWNLEGSFDGQSQWTTLISHKNDTKVANTANASASWEIPNLDQEFKFFRVLQTGVNSRNDRNFMISGIEIYGTVIVE
jgi:hypothetical protein